MPAYNEEKTIVGTVQSLLNLRFPEFEIIVVSDGSNDRTLSLLDEALQLEAQSPAHRKLIETKPVEAVYRSRLHPRLVVLEKERGGKADALNAGLNFARFPLVCHVDADSVVEGDALLRGARIFGDDERVVAVGGGIRPLNGSVVADGRVEVSKVPKSWLERFQVVEYARAFGARAGWGSWNSLLLISGAFGIFRRESLLQIGGHRPVTVAEDLDLVVRLHRFHRDESIPYRIVSLPETMCWTQVPSDFRSLRRQRNRWHRGLWEVLWNARGMLLRPRYGRLGLVVLPYFWLFEGLAPLVEVAGYLSIPLLMLSGAFDPVVVLSLALIATCFGLLLSFIGLLAETLRDGGRGRTVREQGLLVVAACLELLGFRQLLALERLWATFQLGRRRGRWGEVRRHEFGREVVELPATRSMDATSLEIEEPVELDEEKVKKEVGGSA